MAHRHNQIRLSFLFDQHWCNTTAHAYTAHALYYRLIALISVLQIRICYHWVNTHHFFLQISQHSFVEIDHELFSTVILSLPLIQKGQLSVSGERMCTIQVNGLEHSACPVNVWLGKLTTLDMTQMGWLGCKTSTQTNSPILWRGF